MVTISSRSNTDAIRIARLQEILTEHSAGVLGASGHGAAVDLGTDLDTLVDQADQIMQALRTTLNLIAIDQGILLAKLDAALLALDVTQDALANLIDVVDYDEALDHATADLMDCFCASGAADVSADGELIFDERITFSKEDLKPMLREAIIRWIELKMSQ